MLQSIWPSFMKHNFPCTGQMHAVVWQRPIVSIVDNAFSYTHTMDDQRTKDGEYIVRENSSNPYDAEGQGPPPSSAEGRGARPLTPQLKATGRSTAAGHMTQLADDFEPGEQDVVCGRGKKYEREKNDY
jgi:hypothetical protein